MKYQEETVAKWIREASFPCWNLGEFYNIIPFKYNSLFELRLEDKTQIYFQLTSGTGFAMQNQPEKELS